MTSCTTREQNVRGFVMFADITGTYSQLHRNCQPLCLTASKMSEHWIINSALSTEATQLKTVFSLPPLWKVIHDTSASHVLRTFPWTLGKSIRLQALASRLTPPLIMSATSVLYPSIQQAKDLNKTCGWLDRKKSEWEGGVVCLCVWAEIETQTGHTKTLLYHCPPAPSTISYKVVSVRVNLSLGCPDPILPQQLSWYYISPLQLSHPY